MTDPLGNTVFWGRPSIDGGQLDHDENAACSVNVTNSPVEDIYWPVGAGIEGTYTVRVGFYDSCDISTPPTYSIVAKTLSGGMPQTITFIPLPSVPPSPWNNTTAIVGTFIFTRSGSVCTISTLQTPNVSQIPIMAQNMDVVDSSGLYLRYGPTINAEALRNGSNRAFVAWNVSNIPVLARVVFSTPTSPVTPNPTPQQIWYQVQTSNGTGWILIAVGNTSFLAGSNLDPCASQYPTAPNELTFPYDRQAAANYGIEQGYQNNSVTTPGNGRVTSRLLTPVPDVLFANFDYHSELTGTLGATGSAMFVSEGIWMGGLPMTRDIYVSPPPAGQDPDGNWDCSLSPAEDSNQSGWRYCPMGSGGHYVSIAWKFHSALAVYFTHSTPPGGVVYDNRVLDLTGSGAGKVGSGNTATISSLGLGRQELMKGTVPPQLPGLISKFLKPVKQGDYVWVDSTPDHHGLLVVGWGPLLNCQQAMNTRFSINSFSSGYPNSPSAPPSTPYVVDFSGAIQGGRPQESIPRPFYCTYFNEIGKGSTLNPQGVASPGAIGFPHSWWFYTLPDQVTVALPPTTSNASSQTNSQRVRLFVWPTWDWTASDGVPIH